MPDPKDMGAMMKALIGGSIAAAGKAFVGAYFPTESVHDLKTTTYIPGVGGLDNDDVAALGIAVHTLTKAAAMKKKDPVLCNAAATTLERLDLGNEECAEHIIEKCCEVILEGCKGMHVYGDNAFSPERLVIGREDDIDPFYINDVTPHLIVRNIVGLDTRTDSYSLFFPLLKEVIYQAVFSVWEKRLMEYGNFDLYDNGGMEPSHPTKYDWTWAAIGEAVILTTPPVIKGALEYAPHLPHGWPKPIEAVPPYSKPTYLGEFAGKKNVNAFAFKSPGKAGPQVGDTYYDTMAGAMKMYIGGNAWVAVADAEYLDEPPVTKMQGSGLAGDLGSSSKLHEVMNRFDWSTGEYTMTIKRSQPSELSGHIGTLGHPIDEGYLLTNFGGGAYDITVRGPHPTTGAPNAFLDGCRVHVAVTPTPMTKKPHLMVTKPPITVSLNGQPVKQLDSYPAATDETMDELASSMSCKGNHKDELKRALDKRRGIRPNRTDFVIAAREARFERREDEEPTTLKPTIPSGLDIEIDDDEPVDF